MRGRPLFLLALAAALLFLTLVLGRLIVVAPPLVPMAIVGVLFAGLITLLNPKAALVLLVFSMLLSPEIAVAEIPRRSVVIRIDDLLLVTMFFVWMTRTAMSQGLGFFVRTPLNRPITVYTALCAISTMKGVLVGDISWIRSSFYLLKYVEYFFLFIMVSNLVDKRSTIRNCLIAGAVTAFIVAVYAYAHIGRVDRLYAPFDHDSNNVGEPATLGGYLLIVMSFCLALFTEAEDGRTALAGMAGIAFLFPPFVYTLSRASYLGYTVVLAAVFFFTKRRRPLLFGAIVGGIIFVPFVAPDLFHAMMHRTMATFFQAAGYVSVGGYRVGIESSAQDRVTSWRTALTVWLPHNPFLGSGITGVGLVDAQYPLVLGETGLAGFAAFIWLLVTLFRNVLKAYRGSETSGDRALCLGLLLTIIGLCVQSLTTNSFIIVRIMEPFWFLAALVMRLMSIREAEKTPAPA